MSAAGYDAAGAVTSWGGFNYERDSQGMIKKLTGGGLNLRYVYTAQISCKISRRGAHGD